MGIFNLIRTLNKRSKIERWEVEMLLNILSLLPDRYAVYHEQIVDGLLKGVVLSDTPKPNFVNFSFDPQISKKYEQTNGRYLCLSDIRISDNKMVQWNDIEIYISHGLVSGYWLRLPDRSTGSYSIVDVSDFKQTYLDGDGLDKMYEFLDDSEIERINPSDFYEVTLGGRTYYHIRDLEDGDFIGIDNEKNVYKISHDPYEIRRLSGDILSNL